MSFEAKWSRGSVCGEKMGGRSGRTKGPWGEKETTNMECGKVEKGHGGMGSGSAKERMEARALSLLAPKEIVRALSPLVGDKRAARLKEVAGSRLGGLGVVLENLHDPHNGAAVLRSCEAFGIKDIHVIAKQERFRFSDKVTQGCDKWLDVLEHTDTDTALAGLSARGFRLAAAVPGAKTSIFDLDPRQKTALLLGNEHAGLSGEARALCDVEFGIPLFGFSESLNLSVAAAVCVFTLASAKRTALGANTDLSDEEQETLLARYLVRDVRGALSVLKRHAEGGCISLSGAQEDGARRQTER